jgi:hypothetical protein
MVSVVLGYFFISSVAIGFPDAILGSDICVKKCELKQLKVVFTVEMFACFIAKLVTMILV